MKQIVKHNSTAVIVLFFPHVLFQCIDNWARSEVRVELDFLLKNKIAGYSRRTVGLRVIAWLLVVPCSLKTTIFD